MANFVEFEVLSEDISTGDVHDFAADSFKWYFTNTAPDAAADTQKTELPSELANGNGYTTGGLAADLSIARSGGQTTVSLASNVVLTATGAVGPFRYLCLYNDTATNEEVLGYLDHGSSVNMVNTDTYTIPSGALFTIN
jgi:hypothetical protein